MKGARYFTRFKMLALALVSLLFCLSASAEGLADRRNEIDQRADTKNVIQSIHKKYGHTAAGGSAKHVMTDMHEMEGEHGTMKHPQYKGLRSDHKYKGLSGHQYKRRVFGSNN